MRDKTFQEVRCKAKKDPLGLQEMVREATAAVREVKAAERDHDQLVKKLGDLATRKAAEIEFTGRANADVVIDIILSTAAACGQNFSFQEIQAKMYHLRYGRCAHGAVVTNSTTRGSRFCRNAECWNNG